MAVEFPYSGDATPDVEDLRAKIAELEKVLLLSNDAMCTLTGMLCQIVVAGGLVGREELSQAIEVRASPLDQDDHNPILLAFARMIRMNLPGGRFDVIQGGRPDDIDPNEK